MGIYEPDQITDCVNYYWKGVETCNKAQAKKTVKKSVNYLGGRESGGKRFEAEAFESQYKIIDMMGSEKNSKGVITTMVTGMIA